ncbi:MAG TPA: VCBS repeat-containing protein [Planctomycetaceae bacterium]|nr:VCBS repeat-containing protein [Planctomycetaceae bacterium]
MSACFLAAFATFASIPGRVLPASEPPGTSAADLSPFYGFRPLEVFKLERRSQNIVAGDLNHDGLTDLVLVDNSHSRIDLLLQRAKKPVETELTSTGERRDVNMVENDWRFEHRKVPVDKEVHGLALGDLNGDGRADLAYVAMPDRLIVRYQAETGDWTSQKSFRLPDLQPLPWILTCGDLNGDGRDDVVVLGKHETFLFYQTEQGELDGPQRVMNTSDKLALARITDIDGDGRNDLSYVADGGDTRLLCTRLQQPDGRLGPELQFDLKTPRAITLADLDGRPGAEILTIDLRTGRLDVRQMVQPDAKPGEPAGRLVQYGFGDSGSGRDRDLATGDLDGDGLIDVVVTDPDTARMIVFRQHKERGLDLGQPFPGLLGATQIRVADLDGDGRAEVVLLSPREKTLGLSRFEGGRLTFPQALPAGDDLVAFELADLDADGREEIVVINRSREGRSSSYALQALRRTDDGGWQPKPFGETASVALDLAGTPDRLLRLDANADGRADFLVFFGADRPPRLLVTGEDGVPKPVDTAGGIQLGSISAGAVFAGRTGRPFVLVAQDKFARNLALDGSQWRVNDQYNAPESNARTAGVAALDLDGEPGDEIVLVDTGVKRLRILREEENLYKPWREVEIGDFPYLSARVADLNGDGRDDLVLFGRGKFGVLYAGRTDPELKDLASYETKLKDAFFSDCVVGDLNGDGRRNVAAFDTSTHFVEILDYDPEAGLRRGLHFKLYEEKSFTAQRAAGTEPRESLITDVTGDGLADLVLLAHDRVLVYPQDNGQ